MCKSNQIVKFMKFYLGLIFNRNADDGDRHICPHLSYEHYAMANTTKILDYRLYSNFQLFDIRRSLTGDPN